MQLKIEFGHHYTLIELNIKLALAIFTITALLSVYLHYTMPLEPCTYVFTTTTGLPCAHKVDSRRDIGLQPADFHPHWYWDRYTCLPEIILEPLRVISHLPSSSSRTHSTRRIPSGFEASETQERRCGLCHLPGYTRASLQCTVNIRRLRDELAPELTTQSTNSASLFVPRSTVQGILDSASQSALKSALGSVLQLGGQFILKSTIQSILNSTTQPVPESTTQPVPEPTTQPVPESNYTCPIWPGHPELIYQRYLSEKEAWLTAHPTVRHSNYRKARGLEYWSVKYRKEQLWYLPKDRIDLQRL
jgi:hypothetical protein